MIVLSKLYSNSMMVLVNDRLSSSEESRHATSHMITAEISAFHLDIETSGEDLAADGLRSDPSSMTARTAALPPERCDQLGACA
jgi:hypothetical protein